jgi:ABC-type uncharacterized transport system substrate-binding protein
MDRRAFIGTLASSLLAAPIAAAAQQRRRVPLLGVLNAGFGPRSRSIEAARRGLRGLGYGDSQIELDVRFAGGKSGGFHSLATALVRRQVDVLLAIGPAAVTAARDTTSTIPIVAVDLESDPIQAGFARSLAHPGGNITGLFLDQPGLAGKWLELLKEAAPDVRRVAILRDPTTGPWQLAAMKMAAQRFGVELQILEVRASGELDAALGAGARGGSQAIIQLSSPLFDLDVNGRRVADFAVGHHLSTISLFTGFAQLGGLMAYGPNVVEYYEQRLALYIDRILRGAKPADLPIEQPEKFELVINLKTAKALGLTIPPSLLQRADQVIE